MSRKYLLPFILVCMLFLMWGVANNMNDTLLAAFKRIMSMSDVQTSLVQMAFYGAYFCFALPAAMFIQRYTYKAGILLGLALYAAGTMLFLPAGQAASYPFFLCAIYVMAGGCAILETTANPFILSLGDKHTATRRLNVAQTFNPIGAITGILISRHFILKALHGADATQRTAMSARDLQAVQSSELTALSTTYMWIGVALIVFLILIACVRMPKATREAGEPKVKTGQALRSLWRHRRWRYGIVAQFFYVGAQTGVWSFTIRIAMVELGMDESQASMIFLYSILAFTLFRFIFTWLMGYFRPVRLLAIASVAAIICSLITVCGSGWSAIVALISISACMSLMFPTIYGLALEYLPQGSTKIAASPLIMAILGGALLTPLQAWVSDEAGISISFVIPAICFAVVFIYSYTIIKYGKPG